MKQIQIRIYPDGQIKAETHGIKGKQCMKYIKEVEKLTDAVTIDSDFTPEYLEQQAEALTGNTLINEEEETV